MATDQAKIIAEAREALNAHAYAKALSISECLLADLEDLPAAPEFTAEAFDIAGMSSLQMAEFPLAQEYLTKAADLYEELLLEDKAAMCRLAIAESNLRQGNIAKAKHICHSMIKLATSKGWDAQLAHSTMCLGNIHWMEGEYDISIELLNDAIARYGKLNDDDAVHRAKSSLGVALAKSNRWTEAETLFRQSLDYFLMSGNTTLVEHCFNNLAGFAFEHEDYERAREYLLQCVDIQNDLNHRGDLMVTWFNLGLTELQLENQRLAKKHFHRSYQLSQELGDRILEGSTLVNLGLIELYQQCPVEALNYANLAEVAFAGIKTTYTDILTSYMPFFLLANNLVAEAVESWQVRPDNESGSRPIRTEALLQLLTDEAYADSIHMTDRSRDVAKQWLDGFLPEFDSQN